MLKSGFVTVASYRFQKFPVAVRLERNRLTEATHKCKARYSSGILNKPRTLIEHNVSFRQNGVTERSTSG